MDKKMQMPESKEIYKLRKEIIEPVFGDIKENKGVTGFLTRGLNMVKTEMNLISIANNIYRFHLRRSKPVSGRFAF
jgi:transposase